MRNTDMAVLGKVLLGVLVTQPQCSQGSSLFYELPQLSCRAELNSPVYHINGNHCFSSGKTL